MIHPAVADLNHANSINLTKVKGTGVLGLIHKATQGFWRDPAYRERREAAEALGFLWGAYDFATGDTVRANVNCFFGAAQPGAETLMCLDFEDNSRSEMSATQAHEFLDRVDQRLGRACWIYGGNRIREHVPPDDEFFAQHPLWLCQYKLIEADSLEELDEHIRVPPPWKNYTLLQYTGDGVGPRPHTVDGLEDGADLSAFGGNSLASAWVAALSVPPAIAA